MCYQKQQKTLELIHLLCHILNNQKKLTDDFKDFIGVVSARSNSWLLWLRSLRVQLLPKVLLTRPQRRSLSCALPLQRYGHVIYLVSVFRARMISTLSFDKGLQLDGGTPLFLTNTGPADTTAWLCLASAWCAVLLLRCWLLQSFKKKMIKGHSELYLDQCFSILALRTCTF